MYKTSSHIKQHYSQHQSHHITSHQLSINKHLPLFRFKHIAYKLSPSPQTSIVTHHHSIAINITNKLINNKKTILNCTHTHTQHQSLIKFMRFFNTISDRAQSLIIEGKLSSPNYVSLTELQTDLHNNNNNNNNNKQSLNHRTLHKHHNNTTHNYTTT